MKYRYTTKRAAALVLTLAIAATTAFGTGNFSYADEISDAAKTQMVSEEAETEAGQAISEAVSDDPEADRSRRENYAGDESTSAQAAEDDGIMIQNSMEELGIMGYGIDVSEHNGTIDWAKVKAAGVDFAIIRVGYRGYGTGKLVQDTKAVYNIEGALNAGINVGVYFFSTAITEEEAREEARMTVDIIKDYDITYPVVFDNEGMYLLNGQKQRDYDLTPEERTDMAIAFMDEVKSCGYAPMMYASSSAYYDYFEVSRLENNYVIWVAQYLYYDDEGNLFPDFETAVSASKKTTYSRTYTFWQFSSGGQIDGISGNVDLDFVYSEDYDTLGQTRLVRSFVRRLYTLVLERNPDTAELNSWVNALLNQKNTAAEATYGFVFSDEFTKKNLSNEDYVDILYRTCLDREADAAGRASWIDLLEGGFSRLYVLQGFIGSPEFEELAADCGISRGSITLTENRDKNTQTTKFVRRCYNVFLDREPDTAGLNDWTGVILKDTSKARSVPYGFVFSNEMNKKNLSNEDFVAKLYEGILGREADAAGLKAWVKVLEGGKSREHVFAGFVDSKEFTELLAEYGL